VGQKTGPLFYVIHFSKLLFRVKNETILIAAKNRVYLCSISEVRSYITEWPRFPFFGPPCICAIVRVRVRVRVRVSVSVSVILCSAVYSM